MRVDRPDKSLERHLHPALGYVQMSASEASVALADLDLMGINSRTMYADLTGAARAAVRRVLR